MIDTVTTTQEPKADAPSTVVDTPSGDDLSSIEREYLSSRGERGLEQSTAAPVSESAETTTQPVATDNPADAEDGEVIIDAAGNIKDRKTGRFVPHGAFHREREARKGLELQLQETRLEAERTKERLAILSQAIEPQAKTATATTPTATDGPPDPDKDIFGYVRWLGERNAALEKQMAATEKSTTTALTERDTADRYRSDAVSFAREKTDFGDAYTHLVKTIDAELADRGMTDPAKRMARIAAMEKDEVSFALETGKRPAEWMYQLAARRGYVPNAASGQPSSEKKPVTAEPNAKLTAVARGQEASKSLSSAGGGAGPGLTPEAIANMDEGEFAALLAKNGGVTNSALRKILGG